MTVYRFSKTKDLKTNSGRTGKIWKSDLLLQRGSNNPSWRNKTTEFKKGVEHTFGMTSTKMKHELKPLNEELNLDFRKRN